MATTRRARAAPAWVKGPAGDQWLAYHAWTAGAIGYETSGTRSLRYAMLAWRNGSPLITR